MYRGSCIESSQVLQKSKELHPVFMGDVLSRAMIQDLLLAGRKIREGSTCLPADKKSEKNLMYSQQWHTNTCTHHPRNHFHALCSGRGSWPAVGMTFLPQQLTVDTGITHFWHIAGAFLLEIKGPWPDLSCTFRIGAARQLFPVQLAPPEFDSKTQEGDFTFNQPLDSQTTVRLNWGSSKGSLCHPSWCCK